jgi:pyrroline-5-carboxylate reductase
MGKMGSAIARGLKNKHPNLNLTGYDPLIRSDLVNAADSPESLESACDIVLLCVKPQEMKSALASFKGNKQYISIAAGLSTSSIQEMLGGARHIARAMPNLNASIQMAATGIYSHDSELGLLARAIFECVGAVEMVEKEELLHVVTGLSGSGPAFVFEFIDALAQGAVQAGLPYERALRLAAETLIGSASLVVLEKKHPLELRSQVASPGGTTIAGLAALEELGFRSAVMRAVVRAKERSEELGK